jgi:pimeloyl-ACP methyl ester carboxylesterase
MSKKFNGLSVLVMAVISLAGCRKSDLSSTQQNLNGKEISSTTTDDISAESVEQHFLDIDGTKIFYTEKNKGAAQTIFFIHGNSGSHDTWKQQFNSSLLSSYRLIAFDLPAHGLSDEAVAVTDGYALPGVGKLMAKAITRLINGKPFILAGVSLGTNVVGEILPFVEKPAGIILVSPSIISSVADLQKAFLPNPNAGTLFSDNASVEDIRKLVTDFFFTPESNTINVNVQDYMAVKAPFRSLLLQNAFKVSDEIAALNQTGIPALVVFGQGDLDVNPNYLDDVSLNLFKNQLVKLPNARHFVHIDQAGIFNKLVAEYVADRF